MYNSAGTSTRAEREEEAELHRYATMALQWNDPRDSDDVVNIAMAPDTPEFQAIAECLPEWTGNRGGSRWTKAGTKIKLG